jgi:hypothetical protein
LKRTRFIILVLFVTILIIAALPASAQEPITIDTLVIRFWPEFDRASVLVIYSGQLADSSPLPAELTFTLPETASLHAAAYADLATGSLLDADSAYDEANRTVTLSTPNGSFHVEYYDDSISFDGNDRNYAFDFSPEYPINELNFEAQEPFGATNFETDPAATSETTDEFGLANHRLTTQGLEVGESLHFNFRYAKPDFSLTADRLQAEAVVAPPPEAAPTTSAGAAGSGSLTIVLWVIVGVLIAVIGFGTFYYFRQAGLQKAAESTRQTASSSKPARSSSKPAPVKKKGSTAGRVGQRYCTQCGEAVGLSDKFCRHCGKELR